MKVILLCAVITSLVIVSHGSATLEEATQCILEKVINAPQCFERNKVDFNVLVSHLYT